MRISLDAKYHEPPACTDGALLATWWTAHVAMAHCPGWSRDTSPATDNELRKCFDITLHLVLSLFVCSP